VQLVARVNSPQHNPKLLRPAANTKPTDSKPGLIPKGEMDILVKLTKTSKVKRACKFWNASSGCNRGDGCTFEHKCIECGLDHRWCDVHRK
jgi:hypothetical protein